MDISIFLAKVLGLYLFLMAIVMYVNRHKLKTMINDANGNILMLVTGSKSLLIGILLVVSHNIWEADWKGLITLIGWLLLIKGLMRLFFAEYSFKMIKKVMHFPMAYCVIDLIILVVGGYLSYVGFMS